jgi:hypothetical protein
MSWSLSDLSHSTQAGVQRLAGEQLAVHLDRHALEERVAGPDVVHVQFGRDFLGAVFLAADVVPRRADAPAAQLVFGRVPAGALLGVLPPRQDHHRNLPAEPPLAVGRTGAVGRRAHEPGGGDVLRAALDRLGVLDLRELVKEDAGPAVGATGRLVGRLAVDAAAVVEVDQVEFLAVHPRQHPLGQPVEDVVEFAEQRAGVGDVAERVALDRPVQAVHRVFLAGDHQVRFVLPEKEAVDQRNQVIPGGAHVAGLVGQQGLALIDTVLDLQDVDVLNGPGDEREVGVFGLLDAAARLRLEDADGEAECVDEEQHRLRAGGVQILL